MRIKTYSLKEGLKYLDIPRDRLHYWIHRKRLIKPIIMGFGRGGRTRLSIENLLQLRLIEELLFMGIELNAVKKIINEKRKYPIYEAHTPKKVGVGFKSYNIYEFIKIIQKENPKQEVVFLLEIWKDRMGKHYWDVLALGQGEAHDLFFRPSTININLSRLLMQFINGIALINSCELFNDEKDIKTHCKKEAINIAKEFGININIEKYKRFFSVA